jgi:hypothetical protein
MEVQRQRETSPQPAPTLSNPRVRPKQFAVSPTVASTERVKRFRERPPPADE